MLNYQRVFFWSLWKLTIFPNKPISRGISRQAMFDDTEGILEGISTTKVVDLGPL